MNFPPQNQLNLIFPPLPPINNQLLSNKYTPKNRNHEAHNAFHCLLLTDLINNHLACSLYDCTYSYDIDVNLSQKYNFINEANVGDEMRNILRWKKG